MGATDSSGGHAVARRQPSPLRLGALATLGGLALAAVAAVATMIDQDPAAAAAGLGVVLAFFTFAAGAALVCALACLARARLELVALLTTVVASVALDLVSVAVWLDIDSDAYGKAAGVAFVWTLVAFLVLALQLAASRRGRVAGLLFAATALAYAVVGVLATDLVLRGEDAVDNPVGVFGEGASGAELRLLGAAFALAACGWLATIAAGRLERAA